MSLQYANTSRSCILQNKFMFMQKVYMHKENQELGHYSIKLEYAGKHSQLYKESITYCATIDLLITYGIHSTQSSASIITLETASDRLLAVLALSNRSEYTVHYID